MTANSRDGIGRWVADPAMARERYRLLSAVALDLLMFGRASSLLLAVNGQPVLRVRTRSGLRSLDVVAVADQGGVWSYLWDSSAFPVSAGSEVTAARIAGVDR